MVEIVFLMLIMKVPIVYLVAVVWYAVHAEPRPLEGAAIAPPAEPTPWRPWARRSRRPHRGGPHGRPSRARAQARVALARGERRA